MTEVENGRIAIGFPGQGVPHDPIKIRRLFNEHPSSLNIVLEGEEVLKRPLLPLLLKDKSEYPLTRDNQVRLYLASAAFWLTAETEKVIPEGQRIFFGASAGEYGASWAAGYFDFAEGLEQIDIRGQEMQKANHDNPGTMMVVTGMPFEEAQALEKDFDGIKATNENPGTQTVFSGKELSLLELAEYLASSEAWRHVNIHWTGIAEAAHHPIHMGPAVEGVKSALSKAKFKRPRYDLVGNRAKTIKSVKGLKKHLAAQLTREVLLAKSTKLMRDEYNANIFVDVGPGNVLYTQLRHQFRKTVQLISVEETLLPE
jgi:malonyl CoA-acyl carrier protein transacylase